MNVQDTMVRGVVTGTPDETVRSIVQKMILRRVGAVPIVGESNRLLGIITARDIMMPMFASYREVFAEDVHALNFEEMEEKYPQILTFKAQQIMTPSPVTVQPEDKVLKAASIMGLKNLRRIPVAIPVAESGKLVGIISIGDIQRALYMHQEELLKAQTLRAA